jgi:Helix-turn-helix domain
MTIATRLGLTTRQVRRLVRQYEQQGPVGLISKLRNRPSNRRLKSDVAEHAFGILRSTYADFGPTLAAEKLRERHGVDLAVETVRSLMVAGGLVLFVGAESTFAYFEATHKYLERYGKPLAFYSDKASVFRGQQAGCGCRQGPHTRALYELNIDGMCANTPKTTIADSESCREIAMMLTEPYAKTKILPLSSPGESTEKSQTVSHCVTSVRCT